MPAQRSWGFFIFIACALAVTFIAAQRQTEENIVETQTPLELPSPAPEMLSAPAGLMAAPVETTNMGGPRRASLGRAAPIAAASTGAAVASSGTGPAPAQTQARATTGAKGSGRASSEISFEADSIVTSEGSVAAVFLIKRSQPAFGPHAGSMAGDQRHRRMLASISPRTRAARSSSPTDKRNARSTCRCATIF